MITRKTFHPFGKTTKNCASEKNENNHVTESRFRTEIPQRHHEATESNDRRRRDDDNDDDVNDVDKGNVEGRTSGAPTHYGTKPGHFETSNLTLSRE